MNTEQIRETMTDFFMEGELAEYLVKWMVALARIVFAKAPRS